MFIMKKLRLQDSSLKWNHILIIIAWYHVMNEVVNQFLFDWLKIYTRNTLKTDKIWFWNFWPFTKAIERVKNF